MIDLNMELRTGSGSCLYEQIYEHIKKEIREGKLLAGEKLPSARSLAEYLQVSRNTVDFAYEQLLSEGYIEARPYKGHFVCRVEDLYSLPKTPEATGTAGRVIMQGKQKYPFDFSPNAIDMNAFPFSVWNRISRGVFAEQGIFTSGSPQGEEELRITISRYLHSSRGVNCSPEQIIIGAGNDYLLMLLEKILGRHVNIAMENPTYKHAFDLLGSFAYHITAVDMDEAGMKVEDLKNKPVTAAYVMPSHQFPTGVVMPIGRRSELLGWAAQDSKRYLIEDDYDSEFRYRGKPIPSLQGADQSGSVIYIGTFSKAIAPAIRISYMVLPYGLLEIYREHCGFYSSTVSRIDQRILNRFISEGHFERHLNRMRKVYKAKHDKMLLLLKPFRKRFHISGENAGLHLLLTCQDGRSEEELIRMAAQEGVKVYGLSESFVAGKPAPPWNQGAVLLLGYGGLSEKEMEEGMKRLSQAWL